MKTKFKHIYFEKISDSGKTSQWECYNNSSHDLLGNVEWYTRWRQYCFCPEGYITIFSGGCLDDISAFMKDLRKTELEAR